MENLQNKIQYLLNLYKSKQFLKAENINKQLLKVHYKEPFLYNSLGLILSAQNKISEAINTYEDGLKINPNFAEIYNNLGTTYKSINNFDKAKTFYYKAISIDKNKPEPFNNLGSLYLLINKYNEAIKSYKKALSLNKNFFASYYNLGNVYLNLGNIKDAKKYFTKCIKLNPNFYPAHRNLSSLTKYTKNDKHFNLLKKIYSENKDKNENKTEIAFSLGKAFEDIKDYKNAFKYFEVGNNLRRKQVNFSIQEEEKTFNMLKEKFNKILLHKDFKKNTLGSKVIFILGMPRSGTTLVEQIISSHKDVFAGDELNFLPNLVKKHFKSENNINFLGNIEKFNEEDFCKIGKDYIDLIDKLSNKSSKVTDKLPINFKWIGLIKLILPKSTIIHCVRNPKDVCISIFKNYFTNTNLNYAYDLNEIVKFYNLYHNLMNYWKSVLPNFIYDLKYEDLIQKPEKEIRYLLNKSKLKWDKNCLKYYKNKRPIKTASFSQARKKIYKSSINLWSNYKFDLKNAFDKLPN